jgi:hypothetical protein
MKKSYLENEYVELWIENGIIHEVFKPSLKILNIEIVKQIVADRLKVSGEITRPIFVDVGSAVSIDKAARRYLAKGDALKLLSATAILVDNYIAKLWANIYIRIDNPSIPTQFFHHKAMALTWLAQYKTHSGNKIV